MRPPAPAQARGFLLFGQVPDGSESAAQRLAGLPVAVAVQNRVPLVQQLLGTGIGADLLAALAAAARGCAIGDHCTGSALPEIPGPGDAAFLLPDAVAIPAGTELRIQVLLGVTAAEVAPVGKGLAVLNHHQVMLMSLITSATLRP